MWRSNRHREEGHTEKLNDCLLFQNTRNPARATPQHFQNCPILQEPSAKGTGQMSVRPHVGSYRQGLLCQINTRCLKWVLSHQHLWRALPFSFQTNVADYKVVGWGEWVSADRDLLPPKDLKWQLTHPYMKKVRRREMKKDVQHWFPLFGRLLKIMQ